MALLTLGILADLFPQRNLIVLLIGLMVRHPIVRAYK